MCTYTNKGENLKNYQTKEKANENTFLFNSKLKFVWKLEMKTKTKTQTKANKI